MGYLMGMGVKRRGGGRKGVVERGGSRIKFLNIIIKQTAGPEILLYNLQC